LSFSATALSFHKIAFAQLARVEDIDYFIVDNNITAEDREKFSTLSDIKLIVAGSSG